MARILVIEDEISISQVLKDILEDEGHRVLLATNGADGLELGLTEKPRLILLDIMLPKVDGFTVCEQLRERGVDVPVLMLTAKNEVDDRVRGLDAGADDYLVKPFSSRELLARVRALLRRFETAERRETFTLRLGNLTVDFVRCEALRGNQQVVLSAREYAILRLLAEEIGKPVSREQFLDRVWEYHSFPTTRTVDNHIVRLRSKIEESPENPAWIHTVHGIGYRLDGRAKVDG